MDNTERANEYMSSREVIERLGMTRMGIFKARKAGRLKSYKVAGSPTLIYRRSDLDRFIKLRKRKNLTKEQGARKRERGGEAQQRSLRVQDSG
jgi:hypothetical protein